MVVDYDNHGIPITDATGAALLTPGTAHDLGNPGTYTLLWAWYTGTSADQGQRGNVIPDYGNTLSAWLAGRGHDRHIEANNATDSDYYTRNQDFLAQAAFGTAGDSNALMDIQVGHTLAASKHCF